LKINPHIGGVLLYLFACNTTAIAQTNAPQIDPLAVEFYANTLGQGEVEICLDMYFLDQELKYNETQKIALYESMLRGQVDVLNLSLDSISKIVSAPTCDGQISEYKKYSYSDTVNLGLFITKYIATWGYAGYNTVTNLQHSERLEIAMELELNNIESHITNAAPRFVELLQLRTCLGEVAQFYNIKDTDGDSVSLQLEKLYSNKTVSGDIYYHQTINYPDSKSIEHDVTYKGAILVSNPPYLPVKYNENFSDQEPLGLGSLKINNLKKEITTKTKERGQYATVFSLKDYKDNTVKSQHSLLIMLQVL
jgi:hypothetical protein